MASVLGARESVSLEPTIRQPRSPCLLLSFPRHAVVLGSIAGVHVFHRVGDSSCTSDGTVFREPSAQCGPSQRSDHGFQGAADQGP